MKCIRTIVNVFYVCMLRTAVCIIAETCHDMRTDSFSNKYLSGSGYTTLSPFGYQQCISLCMVSRECQSINYDLGRLDCELNTETTQTATSLTDKNGNVFKDMNDTSFPTPLPGSCQETTCPAYNACVVLSDGSAACIESVPGAESTSVPTPTTTANACLHPYTLTSGLCLYLGQSVIWHSVYNSDCPGTSSRLFITDTADKRDIAAMLCPPSESCWLGCYFGNDEQCYWSNGNNCYYDQRGSGECLRVLDNTFKGGYCGNEFSYICEQL